jgi:hypothetical protein
MRNFIIIAIPDPSYILHTRCLSKLLKEVKLLTEKHPQSSGVMHWWYPVRKAKLSTQWTINKHIDCLQACEHQLNQNQRESENKVTANYRTILFVRNLLLEEYCFDLSSSINNKVRYIFLKLKKVNNIVINFKNTLVLHVSE